MITAHVGDVGQRAERLGELAVRLEGQRVLSLGPIQRDGRHPPGEVPAKVTWTNGGDVDADR